MKDLIRLEVDVLVRGGFFLEPRTSFSSEAAEVSAREQAAEDAKTCPRRQKKSLEDQIRLKVKY